MAGFQIFSTVASVFAPALDLWPGDWPWNLLTTAVVGFAGLVLFEVVVATPILALLLATWYLSARVRIETGRLRLYRFFLVHRRRLTVGLVVLLSALFLGILRFMDLLP